MKNREIAVDSNILIDHFNNDSTIDKKLSRINTLHIPIPVIAEMEYGYSLLKNPTRKRVPFDSLHNSDDTKTIVCDQAVAQHFARIKITLKETSLMIPVNDIWIAACCITAGVPLATRDNHFKRIPELQIEMW